MIFSVALKEVGKNMDEDLSQFGFGGYTSLTFINRGMEEVGIYKAGEVKLKMLLSCI